ncbi:MAG: response regulator transcription factor [Dehalococcoidales bacterium]|nr:response regulator transcription factor [Dehalococcoidales bacterium]
MEKITVVISDWQVFFREGIHFILSSEDDIEVIGEATTNEETLALIEADPPAVAILDMGHSDVSGVEATRRIKRNFPSVGVILIIDDYDEEQLFLAARGGVNAYITKESSPDELVSAVREVTQGNCPISKVLLIPDIASRVLDEFREFPLMEGQMSSLLARLSPMENELLHHLTQGASSQQVAQVLDIAEPDILHHLGIILSKLVTNRRNLEMIETAQSSLRPISGVSKPTMGYITRDEFASFKQDLIARLETFISRIEMSAGGLAGSRNDKE